VQILSLSPENGNSNVIEQSTNQIKEKVTQFDQIPLRQVLDMIPEESSECNSYHSNIQYASYQKTPKIESIIEKSPI
jgi:hypothetical protein